MRLYVSYAREGRWLNMKWVWMKMNMICMIWLKKGVYDMMHEIENKMEMVVIAWKN